MPLTVDTGPRIYIAVQAKSDFDIHVKFAWSEIDLDTDFSIKMKKEEKDIAAGEEDTFTFDYNCNNITMEISDTKGNAIDKVKLESHTVSRTYIIEGTIDHPLLTSHEN